jgi:hypothetical protein
LISDAEIPLDLDRVLATLNRHGVDYLLVGGVSAIAHGATRPTVDFDCLAERSTENLDRLADALKELNARLRVGGLSDEESKALPTIIDARTFEATQTSTWRTDAGDFDVLSAIPDRDGNRQGYADLLARAKAAPLGRHSVLVASLDDVIASKEWANRPKDHDALPELRELRDSAD